MSKKIIFSFDDGRADTYTNAWPILKQYGLTATLNVVSDFVLHPERYTEFSSGENLAVTPEQLREWQASGMEIACHGSTHKNTVEDVLANIEELRGMGLSMEKIGFASPHSELTLENSAPIQELVSRGVLSYIRSGIQTRREGLIYAVLTALERKTHSKFLYYVLNRKNILSNKPGTFLMSAAVTSHTTVDQIMYLLSRMQEDQAVILMFHSVLHKEDQGYGKDTWYWDVQRFDRLCSDLRKLEQYVVCTTQNFVNG